MFNLALSSAYKFQFVFYKVDLTLPTETGKWLVDDVKQSLNKGNASGHEESKREMLDRNMFILT